MIQKAKRVHYPHKKQYGRTDFCVIRFVWHTYFIITYREMQVYSECINAFPTVRLAVVMHLSPMFGASIFYVGNGFIRSDYVFLAVRQRRNG